MNSDQYSNILIIKPSALGDIVHALPVLPSLRGAFPDAKLTWLVRKEFAPLLECIEGLDEILLFDRKGMSRWFYKPAAFRLFWDFAKRLRAGKFDLVLDLQGLCRSAIFSRITGGRCRLGLQESRELAHLFYTLCVGQPSDSVHILDYYFAAIREVGVETPVGVCSLKSPESARQSVHHKVETNALVAKKFLILVPGSAHAYKCWHAERFAEAAGIFHKKYGWPAAVVGTQNERCYFEAIAAHTTSPIVDLTGQTSIPELVALFDCAGAVVSNDTGPGHIALATDTPGVVIFGNTNPRRLGPYRRPECIVAVDADKRGKEIKDTNPAHHIEKVSVEMVLEKIESQITK